MFSANLYDVDIDISIHNGISLVAKATQEDVAWVGIEVDNVTGRFDLLGVRGAYIDSMDDDYIVFRKDGDEDYVTMTLSKRGSLGHAGKLLEYLSNMAPNAYSLDD